MEWITEFLSDGGNATLFGFSGGGVAAVILYISHTIRRFIVRTFLTATITGAGLFGGGHWMGYELKPMGELSKAQEERQETVANWYGSLSSFWEDKDGKVDKD